MRALTLLLSGAEACGSPCSAAASGVGSPARAWAPSAHSRLVETIRLAPRGNGQRERAAARRLSASPAN